MRAELLFLSPSFLVPCMTHDGISVWDTLAIGEYLNEIRPEARLLPQDRAKRARCRSICGEMHSGFGPMRSALPMNLKGDFPNFKVWARAQADIDRITTIWRECLNLYGGPFFLSERICASCRIHGRGPMRFLCAFAPRASIQSTGRFVKGNCGSSCVSIFLLFLVATSQAKSSRPGQKPLSSRPAIPWSVLWN